MGGRQSPSLEHFQPSRQQPLPQHSFPIEQMVNTKYSDQSKVYTYQVRKCDDHGLFSLESMVAHSMYGAALVKYTHSDKDNGLVCI